MIRVADMEGDGSPTEGLFRNPDQIKKPPIRRDFGTMIPWSTPALDVPASTGDNGGELDPHWDAVAGIKTYEVQISPDPFTATSLDAARFGDEIEDGVDRPDERRADVGAGAGEGECDGKWRVE